MTANQLAEIVRGNDNYKLVFCSTTENNVRVKLAAGTVADETNTEVVDLEDIKTKSLVIIGNPTNSDSDPFSLSFSWNGGSRDEFNASSFFLINATNEDIGTIYTTSGTDIGTKAAFPQPSFPAQSVSLLTFSNTQGDLAVNMRPVSNVGSGGGTAAPTNLGLARTVDKITLTSSTGNNVDVLAATGSLAGVMSAADKQQLDNANVDFETASFTLAKDNLRLKLRAGSVANAVKSEVIDIEDIDNKFLIIEGNPGNPFTMSVSWNGGSRSDIEGKAFVLVNTTSENIDTIYTTGGTGIGAEASFEQPNFPANSINYCYFSERSSNILVHANRILASGSGLSAVTSDGTLTGTGTSADALKVAEPYTAVERTKLAGIADNATANVGDITAVTAGTGLSGGGTSGGVTLNVDNPFTSTEKNKLGAIENNATQDQSASEIKAALETLQNAARLDASAIKNLPSGGGGLSAVTSDGTLTGTGTSADALKVAEPYTAGERSKLSGIADNATANVGTVTGVRAGTGLSGGGAGGALSLDIEHPYSAAEKTKLGGIADHATANVGTITGVQAGTGLTGGANSGTATLSITINGLNANNVALSESTEFMVYNGSNVVKTTLAALKAFLGGGGNPGQHKRYVGFKPGSGSSDFVAADFKSATLAASSTTDFVTNPTFTGDHYMAYAIPSSQPAITVWQEKGTVFNSVSSLFNVGTVSLDGEDHVVYRYGSAADTPVAVYDTQSGAIYEIR